MAELVWEAPPAVTRNGRPDWTTIGAELRARPGEWAIVRVCERIAQSSNLAYTINRGLIGAMPYGEFEARSRAFGTEHRVYARYVGETYSPVGEP